MIASLRGTVIASGAGWVVVETNGVGMRAEVPSGRRSQTVPGDDVFLHTSLVVREDSLTLFGFDTDAELAVFTRLIAVNGVGPRSALGILSALTPGEVARAVEGEDAKPFTQVSGIGPKTAKLIVVSLAGKLAGLGLEADPAFAGVGSGGADPAQGVADAVRDGLAGLGWNEADAQRAVDDARAAGAPEDHAGLLRASLSLLQRGGR